MNKDQNKITITIDNLPYTVKEGISILNAAEQNEIYIPTLCAHKELTPYGGCRMCLVEVEGARGFLTACTTPVEEGMIIRTHTDQIQKERREIMQLLLSEHTASCLICEERESCKTSMSTIRKVGVTTGCRFCPNDDQCELEKVVEWLNITEIPHPVYYRGLHVEKEDPFYDRDYNLCIYCGRCVRMCQEIRMANVLAFNQRGRYTVIGPAFDRTHIEAGCEFCGACVSVCPTGALAEKTNKWVGKADREEQTTCALCGVGCQMQILVKNDRVIGTVPADDPLVNNGQLCVKGRFCVNELVNHYQRLTSPAKKQNGANLNIKWDEALEIAANTLSKCTADEFGMLISPNCTNEDLYIAQKFTRIVMGTHNIDTSARLFYNSAFNDYIQLMKRSISLSGLDKSKGIFAIGLDMRYGRSVVGVKIRKLMHSGAKIITIHPKEHSLSLHADIWLRPSHGEELNIINSLIEMAKGKKRDHPNMPDIERIFQILQEEPNPVILIGTEIFQNVNSSELLRAINQLAIRINAGILVLPAQNNLYGSILMGAYPELLPGGLPVENIESQKLLQQSVNYPVPDHNTNWNAFSLLKNDKLKVLYLIGEDPPDLAANSQFIIYQNIYPSANLHKIDLTLPAAAFTEVDGTFINGAGRCQQVRKAVNPPGNALADWQILCQIAQKMGVKGFDYTHMSEIHDEMNKILQGFCNLNHIERTAHPLPDNIRLKQQHGKKLKMPEHSYRSIQLTSKVEGFKKLLPD